MDDELGLKPHVGYTGAKPAHILLVEHELHIQGAISAVIMSASGLELAAVCACKREALGVIEGTPLEIALVSLNLVDDACLEVVGAVRKLQPLCEVLVMGTADKKEDIFSSMQAGAVGFFLKESFIDPGRIRGKSIAAGLTLSRILANRPAVNERLTSIEVQTSGLSPVQGDILRCLARGLSNKEIARNLVMTSYNVDYHLKCLRKRFAARNRVQLIRATVSLFQTHAV